MATANQFRLFLHAGSYRLMWGPARVNDQRFDVAHRAVGACRWEFDSPSLRAGGILGRARPNDGLVGRPTRLLQRRTRHSKLRGLFSQTLMDIRPAGSIKGLAPPHAFAANACAPGSQAEPCPLHSRMHPNGPGAEDDRVHGLLCNQSPSEEP